MRRTGSIHSFTVKKERTSKFDTSKTTKPEGRITREQGKRAEEGKRERGTKGKEKGKGTKKKKKKKKKKRRKRKRKGEEEEGEKEKGEREERGEGKERKRERERDKGRERGKNRREQAKEARERRRRKKKEINHLPDLTGSMFSATCKPQKQGRINHITSTATCDIPPD